MCITCGCSDNLAAVITALDGGAPIPPNDASARGGVGHDYQYAGHGHEGAHAHTHGYEHATRGHRNMHAAHDHEHAAHTHDSQHAAHADAHGHEHAAHEHRHQAAHDDNHRHTDDHPHAHEHDDAHDDAQGHAHTDHHTHDRAPTHAHERGKTVSLETALLAKNDRIAERNRRLFAGRDIVALNLVSAPGSGKTTLLERTIRDLGTSLPIAVIEGDQETMNDAQRIAATGCKVVQINTGTGCHLDADMIARGLHELDPPSHSVVMIENVGNLVCPALFDLGERAKVAILSVTEGEDKPLKYPHMFRAARLMILNKIDLLPYVDFDVQHCIDCAHRVNPGLQVLQVSAIHGQGLAEWYDWLRAEFASRESITALEQI